ncbi:MAG: D-glycerate dehydrogenase [Planctomycetes bacterium]|nr:D-glycerate dehydrogenase [Planctomycetota bacterium]
MDPEIFVTRRIPGGCAAILEASGLRVETWGRREPAPPATLRAKAAPCRGLLTLLSDRVDAALLASCPRLEVVSNYAVGFDNVDVAAATRLGIAVTNTPDVLTDATAELAIALLFAAARRLVEGDALVRAGKFAGWEPELLLGVDVRGKTLGVLGAGRIGAAVARRASALGMRVLYCECGGGRREAVERESGARPVAFDELLRESDFLSIHVPLTPQTRGMIGAAELAAMKPGAILVNTARGPVVDEKALAAALASGRLRAAGLDVYEREPQVEPALLALPNVVLAPHVGSATVETRSAMGELAARSLLSVLEGRRPGSLVNPEAWERRRGGDRKP